MSRQKRKDRQNAMKARRQEQAIDNAGVRLHGVEQAQRRIEQGQAAAASKQDEILNHVRPKE